MAKKSDPTAEPEPKSYAERLDPGGEVGKHAEAAEQIEHWDGQLRRHAFGQQIVGAKTSSVNEGLESAADRESKKLDELIHLQRTAQGLGPADEPEAPAFDPSWESPETQAEIEAPMTSAEIKASVLDISKSAEGGPDVKGGFTSDGKPVSYEKLTRDVQAEERTAERARDAIGIPASLN
jgi:hypothetical protein